MKTNYYGAMYGKRLVAHVIHVLASAHANKEYDEAVDVSDSTDAPPHAPRKSRKSGHDAPSPEKGEARDPEAGSPPKSQRSRPESNIQSKGRSRKVKKQ